MNRSIANPEKLPTRMRESIAAKNYVTEQDVSIYELIEKCEETVKIPWRYIFKDHKD
jgi:hypothetical protein